ncbi:uncharacterized protein LOC123316979 [Coccinella septempunctata]|uniref:uncharacterized protein LOC123316979 n=1 Tax=Coccinella septempunctata TaxID=41139 RepID=UPI001D069492|nr:uncharacterized protein LOC123316979 [Coccinella septempunctata]
MTIHDADINQIPVRPIATLADRREARRRKILENAENRLKKLTGVEQKSHILIDDFRPIQYEERNTDNDDTRLVNDVLPNSTSNSTDQLSSWQSSHNVNSSNGLGDWKNNKLTILIGIALMANLFTILSTIFYEDTDSSLGYNMIFLPFLGFKCLEFYLQKKGIPETNILQLFLMSNLKNNHLKRMLMYTQFLTSFTQDLCIYFFVFVCINKFIQIITIFR